MRGQEEMKYREFCFTVRVAKPWNTLPRDVTDPPSSEIFKTRLDLVSSNLLSLTLSGGLDYKTFKGHFQPQPFCDSLNSTGLRETTDEDIVINQLWTPQPYFHSILNNGTRPLM